MRLAPPSLSCLSWPIGVSLLRAASRFQPSLRLRNLTLLPSGTAPSAVNHGTYVRAAYTFLFPLTGKEKTPRAMQRPSGFQVGVSPISKKYLDSSA